MGADWSNLTEDLLISVAKCLVSFEDLMAFGGVCTTWREASWHAKTSSSSRASRPHQAPWLVSFRGNKKVSGRCLRVEIDSLSPQRPRRSRLLRLSSRFRKAEVVLSSLGWLLTKGCISNEVSLFNPSSRAQIRLPTLLDFIRKFVLSANPSSSKDYKVIVLTQSDMRMAVWKPGKVAWNKVTVTNLEGFFSEVVCHNGLVWAVEFYSSSLVALNIEEVDESPVTLVRILFMTPEMDIQSSGLLKTIIVFYVVESEGEILVVQVEQAVSEPSKELEAVSFRVYKVRDGGDEFERVLDLGDKALFLGNKTSSFAVKASDFAGCQANCIYIAENYMPRTSECAVVGIFSVTFKSYLFRYNNDRDYFLPPLWVQPTF